MGSYNKDGSYPSTSGKKKISHLQTCLCCQRFEEWKDSFEGKIKDLLQSTVQELARSVHEIKQRLDCDSEEKIQKVVDNLVHNSRPRSLLHDARSSALKNFKLNFMGTLLDELITLDKIKASNGAMLMVELLDSSGSRVEFPAKVKIFVLDGDFNVEDTEDWTPEDFDQNVVQPRKNKGELLRGIDEIPVEDGIAVLEDIAFTDNSKSMRNGRFRLGARVVKGFPVGEQIREAVSNSFTVKERRGKLGKGQKRLHLKDSTRHLKNVGQNYAQKLAASGISTVQDLRQLYNVDRKALEDILCLPDNRWSELVKNANSYPLLPEFYKYCDHDSGVELELDCVFNINAVTFNEQTCKHYTALDDSEKDLANQIRRKAYENRQELEVCDALNSIPRRDEFGSTYATPHQETHHPNAMPESMATTPVMTPRMNPTISTEFGGQEIHNIPSHETYLGEGGLLGPNTPGHTADVRVWSGLYQAPQTMRVSSGSQQLGSFSIAPNASLPLGSFSATTPSADFASGLLADDPTGMSFSSRETQDMLHRTNVPPPYMPSQSMPVHCSSSYSQLQNSSQSLDLGAIPSSKKRPWPGPPG